MELRASRGQEALYLRDVLALKGPLLSPALSWPEQPHVTVGEDAHTPTSSQKEGWSNRKPLTFSGPSGCKQQLALSSHVRAEDQTESGLSLYSLSNQWTIQGQLLGLSILPSPAEWVTVDLQQSSCESFTRQYLRC